MTWNHPYQYDSIRFDIVDWYTDIPQIMVHEIIHSKLTTIRTGGRFMVTQNRTQGAEPWRWWLPVVWIIGYREEPWVAIRILLIARRPLVIQ